MISFLVGVWIKKKECSEKEEIFSDATSKP